MRAKICWTNQAQGLIELRKKDPSLSVKPLDDDLISKRARDLIDTSANEMDLKELREHHLLDWYEIVWKD